MAGCDAHPVDWNADLAAAARTVNEGQVSPLITKPCDPGTVPRGRRRRPHPVSTRPGKPPLREVADEQSVRLAQWNQRLEEPVNKRTAELEQANASLERGLLDCVRVLRWLPGTASAGAGESVSGSRPPRRPAGRTRRHRARDVRRIQLAALVHGHRLDGTIRSGPPPAPGGLDNTPRVRSTSSIRLSARARSAAWSSSWRSPPGFATIMSAGMATGTRSSPGRPADPIAVAHHRADGRLHRGGRARGHHGDTVAQRAARRRAPTIPTWSRSWPPNWKTVPRRGWLPLVRPSRSSSAVVRADCAANARARACPTTGRQRRRCGWPSSVE